MTPDAPHEAHDENKVAALVAAINDGREVPPVVVLPNEITAITGSHRIEAWRRCSIEPDCLVLTEEQLEAACASCNLHPEDWDAMDWNDLCAAIYTTCDDAEIKAALVDQR